MAARTATAGTLDSAIDSLVAALDAYLAIATPAGEDKQAAAKYAWTFLQHKLRARVKMKRILDTNLLLRSPDISLALTPSIVELDPHA